MEQNSAHVKLPCRRHNNGVSKLLDEPKGPIAFLRSMNMLGQVDWGNEATKTTANNFTYLKRELSQLRGQPF